MSCELFYFTGTGNSLAITRDLADNLAIEETRITAIKDIIKQEQVVTNADIVGLIYPIYGFGPPNIVCNFIKKIKINDDAYVFSIACNAGLAADSLKHVGRLLGKNGIKQSAGWNITMPSNDILLYNTYPKDKQDKILKNAKEKIKTIAEKIRNMEKGVDSSIPVISWFLTKFIYPKATGWFKTKYNGFYANEKCTSCGTCASICHTKNIILKEGQPVWDCNCNLCLACIHWCPTKAIQHGKKTIKRNRYHNPDISLDDMK